MDHSNTPTGEAASQPATWSRRALLAFGAAAGTAALTGLGVHRGTHAVRAKTVRLSDGEPTCRLVQISDIHHKGNVAYAERVVSMVNGLQPDLVCFTGDLMEEKHYLPEALELLGAIRAPLFGVPGNHEYWSAAPFDAYTKAFSASGGAWLVNRVATVPDFDLTIVGVAERQHTALDHQPSGRAILLNHYPIFVEELDGRRYDLMLAGHSHGGQLRLPGMERRFVPDNVGPYDRGRFDTPAGPLYVNTGIGTAVVPFRINCPPEITLFEL